MDPNSTGGCARQVAVERLVDIRVNSQRPDNAQPTICELDSGLEATSFAERSRVEAREEGL